jgi:hypothetical protein
MLDTRDNYLKSEPNLDDENWDLVVYSDSEAGDVDHRISVTWFTIYFLWVAICWRLKGLTYHRV